MSQTEHEMGRGGILLPIDGSEADAAATRVAVELARSLRARVTMLAVEPMVPAPAPMTAVAAWGTAAMPDDERDELEPEVQDRVELAAAKLPLDVEVDTRFAPGAAGAAILAQAAEGRHDLVVVSWHGTGVLGHLLHDHVVHHVVDHAQIPVVVVPAVSHSDA